MKTVYKEKDQLPYINRELRKVIYSKKMHHKKYQKNKNSKNWELYGKSRNLVNKLKKKSLNNYFIERCTGGCNTADFWKTIKPYLSKTSCKGQNSIVLKEIDKIVTNEKEVADIFNDFFVNVAKDIGQNYTFDRANHPNINTILDQNFGTDVFTFRPTDQKTVSKIIRKFNVKKASGFDQISIKLLKRGQQSLVPLLTNLVNNTIMSDIVPERLKFGQVTPIFKKNYPMDKANHWPVTLLPVHSKIYEKVLAE